MEQGYSDKAYRWNREEYSSKRRFVDIWSFVLNFGAITKIGVTPVV